MAYRTVGTWNGPMHGSIIFARSHDITLYTGEGAPQVTSRNPTTFLQTSHDFQPIVLSMKLHDYPDQGNNSFYWSDTAFLPSYAVYHAIPVDERPQMLMYQFSLPPTGPVPRGNILIGLDISGDTWRLRPRDNVPHNSVIYLETKI